MKSFKKILSFLFLFLLVIQFFRIDKNNSDCETGNPEHILAVNPATEELSELLRVACMDCHSNCSRYPWYSEVAPVSWWIDHHIEEGKEHLNFSEWASYSEEKKEKLKEEICEEIEESEMPLKPYKITHGDARLSEDQKKLICDWVQSL